MSLTGDIFDSQEYSIKLIQIPKVSNTNRNDLAIEFVNWNSLTEDEKLNIQKLTAIVKNKTIRIEGANVGRLKPKDVAARVIENGVKGFAIHHHVILWNLFKVRPTRDSTTLFDTNVKFCYI